jgi:hypothetical protein
VIDRGKSRVTKFHLTEEQAMRDYPECVPKPLLEHVRCIRCLRRRRSPGRDRASGK